MASRQDHDAVDPAGSPPQTTTHVVQPKGTEDALGPGNGHGAPQYVDSEAANPVLESDAKTRGTWFAYLKTKQFWLAMVLGQGGYMINTPRNRNTIASMNWD